MPTVNLCILQWNIRGYYTNLPFLQQAIEQTKRTIICLQETILKPLKNIKLNNFSEPLRKDRVNRGGGGVLMFMHSLIPHLPLTITSPLEVVAVRVYLSNQQITVCNIYLPPDYNNTNPIAELNNILPFLSNTSIITVYSNSHHYSWGSSNAYVRGKLIDQRITDSDLTLLNTPEPTFLTNTGSYSHIDLTIATHDIASKLMWSIHYSTFNSDHFPIIVNTPFPIASIEATQKWHLKSADWEGFQRKLDLDIAFTTPSETCAQLMTTS